MGSVGSWVASVRRETWIRWGIAIGGCAVTLVVFFVWGPGQADVTDRLEDDYDVEQVEWDRGSKVRPERLVVDGRDISDECTVRGAWGSFDDLEIVCTEDVGVGRVETP
jgi:hypothetical protein